MPQLSPEESALILVAAVGFICLIAAIALVIGEKLEEVIREWAE